MSVVFVLGLVIERNKGVTLSWSPMDVHVPHIVSSPLDFNPFKLVHTPTTLSLMSNGTLHSFRGDPSRTPSEIEIMGPYRGLSLPLSVEMRNNRTLQRNLLVTVIYGNKSSGPGTSLHSLGTYLRRVISVRMNFGGCRGETLISLCRSWLTSNGFSGWTTPWVYRKVRVE